MYMRENELETNELVIYRERKEEGNDGYKGWRGWDASEYILLYIWLLEP